MTIDGLWVRILDPIKFLEARKYNHEGRINLEITGQNQSDIEGVYEIDTNGESSIVKKVNSSPDISMRPSDLSSCFFGAITPFELVNSRNINAKSFDKLTDQKRSENHAISTKVNNRKPEYVCLKFINFV